VPPRTRRRASPRPAPVVHQDLYSQASLRAAHIEPNGHPDGPAKRRPAKPATVPAATQGTATRNGSARSAGSAPATHTKKPGPEADPGIDPKSDALEVDEPDEHPALAPPRPAPRRPGLIPTDIADTIGPVLGKAIADIRAHEDGSRRGGEMEDVHKMRVATRRIRAYLKAARPALDRIATDRLRQDVKELAGTLGVIRDHDVMIHRLHLEAGRLGDPDTGALEHLISRLDTERVAGRDQLVTELDDPSYTALLNELDEAAEQPPVADPWADLHDLAAQEWRALEKAHHRLQRRYGKNPPNHELHELRIYGKRARYAAELLHEKGLVAGFLDALAELQEVLGNHQDACVLEDRLRDLVDESGDAHAGVAAGRVIQGCHERRIEARTAYPAAWKKVDAAAEKAFAA
jgi:CHAD domain-containing protein